MSSGIHFGSCPRSTLPATQPCNCGGDLRAAFAVFQQAPGYVDIPDDGIVMSDAGNNVHITAGDVRALKHWVRTQGALFGVRIEKSEREKGGCT
ncbi:MAG TPA: hypothetical protein VGG48_01740 [Rhizomicrobium sp.]|jgi:hypothetical protein